MPKAHKFEEQRRAELLTLSPKAQTEAGVSPKGTFKPQPQVKKGPVPSKSIAAKETPHKGRAE